MSLQCVSCQTRIMSRSWLHLEAEDILYKHQKSSETLWSRHWKTQVNLVSSTSWLNHKAHGRPRSVQLLSRKQEIHVLSWLLPERHTLWDPEFLLSSFLSWAVSFAWSTSVFWDIVMCAYKSNKWAKPGSVLTTELTVQQEKWTDSRVPHSSRDRARKWWKVLNKSKWRNMSSVL